jgi:dTDP-4-amino-4,6-dideoxygalactose transaminase
VSAFRIPFNRPSLCGNELTYVAEAVTSGHIAGDGPFTRRCHALLERELGVRKALLTTSCTAALEMAALLVGAEPGDDVLVPAFTFVSTVNAFVMRGARPVFLDIRPDTLNLDETRLERHITSRTKAIVVVHYAGVACAMDPILAIAQRHGVAVVEDNAQGLFATYKGRPLGTIGAVAAQSFHETKNVTCGEGGILFVNDPDCLERAEVIREKGTNRHRFLRGLVDKYTWVDLGSSYLPSDILAAFLYAQLEAREDIQRRRRGIWERYDAGLRDWAAAHDVRLPVVPPDCGQAYHMFYLLMPSCAARDALIVHLRARGIQATFHYASLHLSEMGMRFGGSKGQCPVAEDVETRLVRLPFYNTLGQPEQREVIEAVHEFS